MGKFCCLHCLNVVLDHTWHFNKHCRDLLQVLALLHQDRASAEPEAAEKWMGYSTMHVAIYAACAASYLLDLLHMQHFTSSPMSAQEPDIFLKACQGRCQAEQHKGQITT